MKRIFIAVKVEPGIGLMRAAATIKSLLASETIKWTDPGNTHLTLAFLGDTDEKRIKILTRMLSERCSGFGEFSFTLEGMGVFKNFREPRVIWAGVKQAERLTELSGAVNSGLAETGFVVGERSFRPHLTLGRIRTIRNTENLKEAVERYIGTEFQKVTVGEVILFESILMQAGPVYKALAKFSLL
jgi:RNA 2',3'-cyclic 3'-phosphodiesterase